MKKIIFCIFLFLGVFGLLKTSWAATITARSCSITDVQTAVDSAAVGDTVNVPAGSCSWSKTLYITKAVQVIGAGAGTPNVTSKTYTCNPAVNTCITTTHAVDGSYNCDPAPYTGFCAREKPSNYAVFMYISSANSQTNYNKDIRFSGFSVDLGDITSGVLIANYNSTYPMRKLQLDNNVFLNMPKDIVNANSRKPTLLTSGTVFGVIHNNYYWSGQYYDIHNGWGDKSWQTPGIKIGSENALFYEDNYLRNTYPDKTFCNAPTVATSHGKSMVVRYNTFIKDASYWEGVPTDDRCFPGCFLQDHGNNGTGGSYSAIFLEAYGNKLTDNYGELFFIGQMRGGKNLVFYNQFITPSPGTSAFTGPYVDFQECEECGGTIYDGRGADIANPTGEECFAGDARLYPTSSCIANQDYLCVDGRIGESNCDVGTTANCYSCSVDGQPQHVWKNYFWNNRDGVGGLNNHKWRAWHLQDSDTPEKQVIENTHYFVDLHGATFDGSLYPVTNIYGKTLGKPGAGCGTLANRPRTCSVGAGYWVTSQSCAEVPTANMGKNPSQPISGYLSTCKSSNTWSENTASDINAGYTYIPYTYPHPLRGTTNNTAPAAPTGVKVI